ncbi:MAG: formylglycine-generating enzyme family protein [Treponema sp.]|nr:formylglycine-generating enzyme family protein [Treponema sp.]
MKKITVLIFTLCFIVTGLAAQQNNMVRINGGTFTMGSPANEAGRDNDEIQRQVTLSSFQMSMYPVTQREYQEIMGTNPSHFKGDNLPVENVTWFDAIEYCIRRSQREGLTPAYTMTNRVPASGYPITDAAVSVNWNANGYRLPTEAEWEYACRAGTTTPFNTGNNITTDQANYDGNNPYNNNAKGEYRRRTMPVGSFSANAWGLYDMHGNVWEWCWDWYGTYATGAQTNPTGAVSGSFRVIRGGSWSYRGQSLRSACRSIHNSGPWDMGGSVGFRLVRP